MELARKPHKFSLDTSGFRFLLHEYSANKSDFECIVCSTCVICAILMTGHGYVKSYRKKNILCTYVYNYRIINSYSINTVFAKIII